MPMPSTEQYQPEQVTAQSIPTTDFAAAFAMKTANPDKPLGLFGQASSSVKSLLSTVNSATESLDTAAKIVNRSLRESLAETVAEGIVNLTRLGYTDEQAVSIMTDRNSIYI